jgi:hypothetical protein
LELVDTAVNAFVVAGVGFLLYLANRGTRKELAEALANLRAENRQDHADLRREIGELRSDLVRVALAVGSEPASPPPQ